MEQQELIAQLETVGHDKDRAAELVRRLAEPGAAAAPGLAAALGSVKRDTMWRLIEALRQIGPPAFDAVVARYTRAERPPDWSQLRFALHRFDERCLPQYTAALDHPWPEIRRHALIGLQNLGPRASSAVRAVLPLLAHKNSYMRYSAGQTLLKIGQDAAPELRAVRRDGPPALRRPALRALALVGGEAALEERDLRVLERLVRMKVADDVPSSLGAHRWLAVPGDAYERLFDIIGLHDRRPCTLAMGRSAMADDMAVVRDAEGKEQVVYRVFVTPELDGWRLVYADTPLGDMDWDIEELLDELSAACGEAQFFYEDGHSGTMVWAVSEDGVPRRAYWRHSDPEWQGEPLAWEEGVDADAEDLDGQPSDEDSVSRAAPELSLDPELVGDRTRMRGHGWLAVTSPDVGHGPFTGILEI
ncbi:HEAT repeat domain-containing protein [Streptomyces sp. NPDC048172]|uniref:HEAT repeat domain-containing protein n=1 Tax=Streptomyces sp. NPDC048172 TaxID=3365505 RepID=UPI003711E1DD